MCYLHVGTEKTGSTSLQSFLTVNRVKLREQKIFFPRSLTPRAMQDSKSWNHILLTLLGLGNGRQSKDLKDIAGITSSYEDFLFETRRNLFDEIRDLPPGNWTMILVSEHIHSRVLTENGLTQIKRFLNAFVRDISIIVYLRPQVELAVSVAGMAVRLGKTEFRPIPKFDHPSGFDTVLAVQKSYFDYESFLSRLSLVFGKENIYPHLFQRRLNSSDALKWNVVTDFCNSISIDCSDLLLPSDENVGLSRVALHLLLLLNVYLIQTFDNADERSALRRKIINSLSIGFPGESVLPSKSEAEKFMNQFETGNELLKKTWFPNVTEIFPIDYSLYSEPSSSISLDMSCVSKAIVEILTNEKIQSHDLRLPSNYPKNYYYRLFVKEEAEILPLKTNFNESHSGAENDEFYEYRITKSAKSLRIITKCGKSSSPNDKRVLGVCFRAVEIDGHSILLDENIFGPGFYAVESNGLLSWRWTNGDATLILPEFKNDVYLKVILFPWHNVLLFDS